MAKHVKGKNGSNFPPTWSCVNGSKVKWPPYFGEHFANLTKAHNILNKAYSDIVATSVIALVVYEEYLLNQTNSQDLAKAMSDLRSSLPADHKRSKQHAKFVRKLRRRNNGSRIGSKRRSRKNRGKMPPAIYVD